MNAPPLKIIFLKARNWQSPGKQTLSWRLCAAGLLSGWCLQGSEGSRTGWRKKLSCGAVVTLRAARPSASELRSQVGPSRIFWIEVAAWSLSLDVSYPVNGLLVRGSAGSCHQPASVQLGRECLHPKESPAIWNHTEAFSVKQSQVGWCCLETGRRIPPHRCLAFLHSLSPGQL